MLSPGANALIVEDLGSRNGTFVNGRRVAKAKVVAGAVLRLGDWVGLVRPSRELTEPSLEFGQVATGLYGSGAMRRVVEAARDVATGNQPLRLEGETGTGKTLVAQAVHELSGRPGRFVSVVCAAISPSLAETELFGAAPSEGADTTRLSAGRLRAAHRGTLLLEDVACLPLPIQAQLLATLNAEAVAGGDSESSPHDVRIIVASHEPLEQALEDGRVAPELYAWLGKSTLHVPSLRHRLEDVAPLFQHFVREFSSRGGPDIEPRLVERLCLYDWPYNVQELRSLAQGLISVYGKRAALTGSILPGRMAAQGSSRVFSLPAASATRPTASRESTSSSGTISIGHDSEADERALMMLVDALRFCQHDLSRACSMVGLSRAEANRLLDSATFLETQQNRARSRHE